MVNGNPQNPLDTLAATVGYKARHCLDSDVLSDFIRDAVVRTAGAHQTGVVDPTPSVRLFEPADAAPLTELLHVAYAELGAMGLNYTAVDQDVETTLVRATGGRCWVVELDGELVATLTMTLPPASGIIALTAEARVAGRAWLNQVAVSPGLRQSGIAGRLWQLAQQWAAEQGATSVGVDTAVPAEHLVLLYKRWGFAERTIIHWEGKTYNSVVMTKNLRE